MTPTFPPSVLLPPTPALDVHRARYDPAGIEYLRQTGRFREYMQRNIDTKNRPFFAWDGEGWTDAGMDHHYMLLMNSSGAHIHAPELTALECLEFILREGAAHPKVIHIIYGGGYDAAMMLKDLPTELQTQLKDNNTVHYNVDAAPGVTPNSFKINYLPHKWLTISGYDWYSHKWVTVKIYDVMTYFQTSFIKALDSRELPVSDEIRSGKAARNTFTYDDVDEIRAYCQQELESLVQLADTLRAETQDAGVYVTQWHGPATIAKALFKRNKVQNHMHISTDEIERVAQHAYIGGHFEQFKAGHYAGKVYLADIRSAYPNALRQLPSLAGAKWEPVDNFTPEGMGVWLCEYLPLDIDHTRPHPTPWRGPGGQVGYPAQNVQVWLWTPEADIPGVRVIRGYLLRPANAHKPFAYLESLYALRAQWKDAGRGGEKALKLGLNSSYGALAQRVGADPTKHGGKPAWHQLEWAGMVTSLTRRKLWDAIALNPASVIAVETDSIMTTMPLDLDYGDNLGQWELKEYEWVTYIQNGIYFTSEGVGKTRSKTRGINAQEIQHPAVMEWLKDPTEPLLTSSRQFIGLGNPRRNLYGQWQDSTKEVKVAGDKRRHNPHECPQCGDGATLAETLHTLTAAPQYGVTPSHPHPLPWRDNTPIKGEDGLSYIGDAVEEYDVPRRAK